MKENAHTFCFQTFFYGCWTQTSISLGFFTLKVFQRITNFFLYLMEVFWFFSTGRDVWCTNFKPSEVFTEEENGRFSRVYRVERSWEELDFPYQSQRYAVYFEYRKPRKENFKIQFTYLGIMWTLMRILRYSLY